jgi:hypothetical protein
MIARVKSALTSKAAALVAGAINRKLFHLEHTRKMQMSERL